MNPDVRANYLASPPLVVAYALAGSMLIDLATEPLGQGKGGKDVFLKDIWPTNAQIAEIQRKVVNEEMFAARYADVFKGDRTGRRSRSPAARPMPGKWVRPMFRIRPISKG